MTTRLRALLLALSALLPGIAPAAGAEAGTSPAPEIICLPVEGKDPAEQIGPIVLGETKVHQVLDLLQKYSGRVILPGENLPEAKLTFDSGGKLSRRDAILALENLLALNGVALRLLENGFVRAIPSDNPEDNAPPLIDEIPENPSSEQIHSKLFRLEYFDSGRAFQRVRGLLTDRKRSSISRQDEINALLVTDSLINLRRIEEVLELLDRPAESRLELYAFPVEHGSAWDIRNMVRLLLRTDLRNRLQNTLVHVDARTNNLLVVTHPTNRDFFADLVAEMDREVAPFTTTAVIKIERGSFWNIWRTVNGIIRHQQRQFRRQGFLSPEERDRGDEEEDETAGTADAAAPGEDGGGAEDAGGLAPAEPATPDSDPGAVMVEQGPPELQFSPYIGIYPDASNNSVVVYGTQSDVERVRALVAQLDVKSPPYIETKVIEVEHARATDVRNVVEYTIRLQQRNFRREQIPATAGGGEPTAMAESEAGFEFSNFVATVADNRNNTLLVQGTRQDISLIENLVEKLDVKSAPLTSNEVIYLEHAQAQTLARVVQNIINYQRWMFRRNRMMTQAGDESGRPTASPEIGFEFSEYAVVNADRRTNALFVYGTTEDIARVRKIVEETDIPVEPMTTTRVLPLTHTESTQTANLINRVIRGQERALRQVRSESREVANPAAREAGEAPPPETAGVVEGDEALQFSTFVSVTPDRRSNSLIVYGTDADIAQVERLVDQIDIEVAPLTNSKIFLLENAQARSLYGVLNRIVRGQERALRQVRSTIREIRNVRPDDPQVTAAELTLEALQFSPYVTITPNDRNNSIIVYGTDSDIAQLEEIIEVSDVEIAPKTQSRTFFIRHADADEVASTISNLIRQQQRVRERERTLTRVFRRDGMAEDEEGNNGDGGMETERFGEPLDTGADVLSESSTQVYDELFSFDEDLQFSPYVSLVADDRSNSVLAYGTEFDLEQIAKLIEQIDDVLPQVRIEVVIAEVILTNDQVSGLESFGISYNFGENPNETEINAQAPRLDQSNNAEQAFDMGVSLNDFSLNSIFRVAKEDSNVKVLSAPSVTTTHNRQATINVGEARPIITSSASNLNNPDLVTRSTVEYRDIGITLRVRPLVSTRGFIQMDLEQIVETVIDTQTIDNNQQPIISTRRASSFLSVRDREVIVLGGLQQVDDRDTDGKVFLLGDLPVFGPLFRPRSSQQIVRELVIFIKPYIVESLEESELMTREELGRTAVGRDIEQFLETGRFREQDKLHPPETEGNTPVPPVLLDPENPAPDNPPSPEGTGAEEAETARRPPVSPAARAEEGKDAEPTARFFHRRGVRR